jgi:hypothetical protein
LGGFFLPYTALCKKKMVQINGSTHCNGTHMFCRIYLSKRIKIFIQFCDSPHRKIFPILNIKKSSHFFWIHIIRFLKVSDAGAGLRGSDGDACPWGLHGTEVESTDFVETFAFVLKSEPSLQQRIYRNLNLLLTDRERHILVLGPPQL